MASAVRMGMGYAVVVAALAGCGTSPEFREDPQVAAPPAEPSSGETVDESQLPEVESPPCGMSSRAVRAQARRGRYSGVEGFDSRTCPPAGSVE